MWRYRIGQSKSRHELDEYVCLTNNLFRRTKAAEQASTFQEEADLAPSPHLPSGPKQDYSLKEGQTFSIKIPGGAHSGRKIRDQATSGPSTFSGGPLLPPPPSRKG